MLIKIGSLALDEIQAMRKEGTAWRVIADFSGVSYGNFFKWKKRYGIYDGKIISNAAKYQPSPKKNIMEQKAKKLGFDCIGDYIRSRRMIGKTRADMAKELGASKVFITRHAPDDMKNYRHRSWNEKGTAVLEKHWQSTREKNARENSIRTMERVKQKLFGGTK